MTTIKDDIEHLIELRNTVSARLNTFRADLMYWERLEKLSKKNSQEKVDSQNNQADREKMIKKDSLYLEVIDWLIDCQEPQEKK